MIALAVVLFVACKKDEPAVVEPVVHHEYGNLKVGNYWTYQHYHIDTNGVETALDKFDTCFIEKDTVVDGHTYYKMIRPRIANPKFTAYFWREFEGAIYDTEGKVQFSAEDFTTIFDTVYSTTTHGGVTDTVYTATSRMVDKDKNIITPAGNFTTRSYQTTYALSDWFEHRNRVSNRRFAKDIGIVCETLEFYASNPTYTERRLVSWGTTSIPQVQ
jgi:hypothetical protein